MNVKPNRNEKIELVVLLNCQLGSRWNEGQSGDLLLLLGKW